MTGPANGPAAGPAEAATSSGTGGPARAVRANGRTAGWLAALVLTMGGLAFASVPFYSWFCKVTGYGGVPTTAASGSDIVLDRTVTIGFDASVDGRMPWRFAPSQREMTVRLGETGLAFFTATNPTDRVVAGTASYNVVPYSSGGYFTKIDCFCFTQQVLQPGETVQMPVSFYVDPAMIDDPEARYVSHITLSYTFYETDLPVDEANLSPPVDKSVDLQ